MSWFSLRKREILDDAMDYRSIALLHTVYKVFTKVIATRVQQALGKALGSTGQGCFHVRQLKKRDDDAIHFQDNHR